MVHLLLACVTSNAVVNERMYVNRFLLHSTLINGCNPESAIVCVVFFTVIHIFMSALFNFKMGKQCFKQYDFICHFRLVTPDLSKRALSYTLLSGDNVLQIL